MARRASPTSRVKPAKRRVLRSKPKKNFWANFAKVEHIIQFLGLVVVPITVALIERQRREPPDWDEVVKAFRK